MGGHYVCCVIYLYPAFVTYEPYEAVGELVAGEEDEFSAVCVGGCYFGCYGGVCVIAGHEFGGTGVMDGACVVGAEAPLCDVCVVAAHCDDCSAAGVPEEVPVVKSCGDEGMVRRGAHPHFVVDACGDWRWVLGLDDGVFPVLHDDGVDFADVAAVGDFGLEAIGVDASALVAALVDGSVAFHCFDDGARFFDGEGHWFFGVDVFAGAGCHDGGEGVPAVACCDEYGVEVVSCEEFAEVAVCGAVGVAVVGVDLGLSGEESVFSGVANCDDLEFVEAEYVGHDAAAATSVAYGCECDSFAGGGCAVGAEG